MTKSLFMLEMQRRRAVVKGLRKPLVFMKDNCWFVMFEAETTGMRVCLGVNPQHAWESMEYNLGLRD